MQTVILAGGLGVRLHPLTKVLPKPLLPIGEKAILEIQIETLGKFGVNEIFLATNYKSEYIENYFRNKAPSGISLHIIKEDIPLGTAGPLSLIRDRLTKPFFLMNGDILTLLDFKAFYDFSLASGSCLNVAIKRHLTPFAFGNIFFDGDRVTGIEEKNDIVSYILTGIYVITPEALKYIPDNQYFGMDELIQTLLHDNVPISKYLMEEYWLDIGQINDLAKAEEEYTSHLHRLAKD